VAVSWVGSGMGGTGLVIFRDKEPTEEAVEWAGRWRFSDSHAAQESPLYYPHPSLNPGRAGGN